MDASLIVSLAGLLLTALSVLQALPSYLKLSIQSRPIEFVHYDNKAFVRRCIIVSFGCFLAELAIWFYCFPLPALSGWALEGTARPVGVVVSLVLFFGSFSNTVANQFFSQRTWGNLDKAIGSGDANRFLEGCFYSIVLLSLLVFASEKQLQETILIDKTAIALVWFMTCATFASAYASFLGRYVTLRTMCLVSNIDIKLANKPEAYRQVSSYQIKNGLIRFSIEEKTHLEQVIAPERNVEWINQTIRTDITLLEMMRFLQHYVSKEHAK